MSLKNNNKKRANELVRFARAFCAEKLPWFAPALFKCQIHLSDGLPVAGIDHNYNIYFNPEAVLKIEASSSRKSTLAQLGFLWIHEISHVLREHRERSEELKATPFKWNAAADFEINDSNWPSLEAPKVYKGLFPKDYNLPSGQLAEYYYKKINDKLWDDILKSVEPLPGFSETQMIDEGSGVHGQTRSWESGESQLNNLDDLDRELVRRQVAKEMKKDPSFGRMPGNWVRWVDIQLKSKVDWRKKLKHKLGLAINNARGKKIDYSFSRPSRRQSIYHPVITPILQGNTQSNITVIIDTSGSMSTADLGQAVAEVMKIVETFQYPITIIPVDAMAYEPIKVANHSDLVKLKALQGGGGTNMMAGIEAALNQKPIPDSILVLTDGYTPYPQEKYKQQVIFGILAHQEGQGGNLPPNPPWGPDTVVEIVLNK